MSLAAKSDGRSELAFPEGNGTTVAWVEPPQPRELGEYLLLNELGRGGMGVVYRGVHRKLKRPVAIKLLPAERMSDKRAVTRFLREMEAVGRLDHPNIVRAYDAGEVEGTFYLAMEFVDGVDVGQLVRGGKRLSVPDACAIISQAATGLQHAYENGLVHRDIKPSNLLLSTQGVVKVADLGLARMWAESMADERFTQTGEVCGTYDYMAPEQADAAHEVDIRADIYSLGCTLYRLLTGQVPFPDPPYDSVARKLMAHAREPPPSLDAYLADVPNELSDAIARMMAKERSQRLPNPAGLRHILARFGCDNKLEALAESARRDGEVYPGRADLKTDSQLRDVTVRREANTLTYRSRALRVGAVVVVGTLAAVWGGWFGIRPMLRSGAASKADAASEGLAGGNSKLEEVSDNASAADQQRRTIDFDEKTPDTWHPLLGHPPHVLLRPPQDTDFRLDYRKTNQEAWVTSSAPSLLAFGKTSRASYSIAVRVRQVPWVGGVGIFFGYDRHGSSSSNRSVQLIEVVRHEPTSGKPKLRLQRLLLQIGEDGVIRRRDGLAMKTIPLLALEEQDCTLLIRNHQVAGLSWNGTEISAMVDPLAAYEQIPPTTGAFGIYCDASTSRFREAQFLYREETQ
jgi:serine/threonine protein kinase